MPIQSLSSVPKLIQAWSRITGVVVLAGLLNACATSSALVRPGDPTFTKAQEQLERTTNEVNALKPPPPERDLFLQAEGFYRYRFEPQPRGAGSYAAEAAAAITDFPAFQSLAGSLDMLDLRYRAPDSAVQLWETLLERYPRTALRPLTLYRLGWAYRNAGANGLPRQSPNSAFDDLIKEQPASPLAELALESKSVPWKSKKTAASYSLIPGLWQMYVGETHNGLVRLGIAALALAAIAVPAYAASHHGSNNFGLIATGFGGLVVLSFDHTSSYEDAIRGVVQWNERAESEFNRTHPSAP
ncbi:MAG: tetratricopeptide repeat protein [Stenotrophobium sp.]